MIKNEMTLLRMSVGLCPPILITLEPFMVQGLKWPGWQ